jgi:sugar phosphate isomerase/epimerase
MRRGISTHMFVTHRLTSAILERIERAGFGLAEIFAARQHFDYRNKAQVLETAGWFRDHELKLQSLHLPMYRDEVWGKSGPQARISITEVDKSRRVEAVDEIKRALEIAETMPFTYAILHVGSSQEEFDTRKLDAALWSIEHLRLFARQRDVSLLLENTPSAMAAPEHLLWLIAELRFPDIGVCFDAGHAHLGGGARAVWERLAGRVRSTHLHDNNGDKDEHLFPFEGTLDWQELAPALAAAGDGLPWLLEIHDPSGAPDPVARARVVFDHLEELTTS